MAGNFASLVNTLNRFAALPHRSPASFATTPTTFVCTQKAPVQKVPAFPCRRAVGAHDILHPISLGCAQGCYAAAPLTLVAAGTGTEGGGLD
jgi:hypothetical protein